jgi:twinkle protein
MSEWTTTHVPCASCGSSDALSVNSDGWGKCFSCDKNFPPVDGQASSGEDTTSDVWDEKPLWTLPELRYERLAARGISAAVCKRFNYGTNGDKQYAVYPDGAKVRGRDKAFHILGKITTELWGLNKAKKGGRQIVITEGEIDAMSVAEAIGNWPVVSLPNGAQSAVKVLKANLEFLETYDKVILCFDEDEAGQAAALKCLPLFSPGKVALTDLGAYKDANEMWVDKKGSDLRHAIWEAKEWRPDGVVNPADLKSRISEKMVMGTEYPWPGLNKLLYGFRPQELVTWTAGTGVGKTALVSELVYHLLMAGKKVGIVYLEEGVVRASQRIVGLHMNKQIHLPDAEYDQAEFDKAFDEILGPGNLVAYDHFGSLDEEVLLNRIRYMVKALDCEVIVLDHISMVVSGASLDADERRMLDHTMTALRSLTQETGASFHVVSHLRRPPGQGSHEEGRQVSLSHLRGTQAIAQLSDAVVALERDGQADDATERNTTVVRVLKNRYAGLTGVACRLLFNHETGRLEDVTDDNGFDGNNEVECPF